MAQQTLKKIALITGANKGIGYEVARQLGAQGYTVLVAARNPKLGTAAANKLRDGGAEAHFMELDVLRPETITRAADAVRKEYGHLDVLVNNAGIVDPKDGMPGVADMDAVRRILDVNFFGALSVTQAFLPLVKAAEAGRIVNVSSGLGSLTRNSDPKWPYAAVKPLGYNGSKAILNMLTVQLAYELRGTKIKVNSADPGYTATDLNGNSGHQTVKEGSTETVRLALLPEDGPTGGYFSNEGPVPW